MKRLLIFMATSVLISCGTLPKRASVAPPRPPEAAVVEPVENDGVDVDDREDSPDEAVEFYLLKRTGGAPLSMDRIFAARRHAASMPQYSLAGRRFVAPRSKGFGPRDANLGSWVPLGPGNIGGRTRGLVIRPDDPNTMYAGAAGGGIWKTTDGGNTWNPLTDLLPSIAITSLAMDPKNPDIIYAGTGELYASGTIRGDSVRGVGIYKTTDGGATWNVMPKPATGNAFDYTYKVVVSPNDSQHIYVTNWVGVYYSPDGGNSWQLQLNRSGNLGGCQDLVIRTDQATDYLFASCAAIGAVTPAVYRNTDAAGAGTWQVVFTTDNMSATSIALAPSNQSIIYAAVTSGEPVPADFNDGLLAVVRSDSNGDSGTWTMQTSNQDPNRLNRALFTNPSGYFADVCSNGTSTFSNQGQYDHTMAVDPLNPDVVWVGGIDVFRSDDGGRNWGIAAFWEAPSPQLAHADNHVILFAPGYNGADNQTLFVASDGGVYRTDNALAATATGTRAACSPYNTAVVWKNVNNGYAVTQFYHGSVYPGGTVYVGGTQDNGTLRGSDAAGALDWHPPIGGDGGFTAIDPADPNIWYGETTHLNFRKTVNGGASFAASTRGITEISATFQFIAPFVMDPSEPKRLYIGGRTLWRTNDASANWSEASSAVPTASGSISTIAVSPTDPNHVVFGTSTGFIYRSGGALATDKNTVWASVQPRPGYVSNVSFDPNDPNVVYATYSQYKLTAAQSHVYKSLDGGATWNGIDGTGTTGLPDIPVFSIIADPQNSTNLYVGSDIGIFVSVDGGATWARDDNPFADTVTETLVLDRSTGQSNLIAFTHGRGVWKTTLPGSGDACQYSLSGDAVSLPANGGTASFKIMADDKCPWSVVPGSSSLTVTSPAGGKGNGSFTVTASRNSSTLPRVAKVAVQDKSITVTQAAALAAAGNDNAASPFAISTVPTAVVENTSSATESANDPVHTCTRSADSKTLWFSVTSPDAGTLQLGFLNARLDNGTDAGTVLTAYRVVNGAVGAEVVCSITPQNTAAIITTRTPQLVVQAGETVLVEVSATTFNSPAGATVLPGNLTLLVNLVKP